MFEQVTHISGRLFGVLFLTASYAQDNRTRQDLTSVKARSELICDKSLHEMPKSASRYKRGVGSDQNCILELKTWK